MVLRLLHRVELIIHLPSGFAPISRTVQFDVVAKKDSGKLLIAFTDIMHAQKETGAATNSGFTPVGAWDGANPDMALSTLKDVAAKFRVV